MYSRQKMVSFIPLHLGMEGPEMTSSSFPSQLGHHGGVSWEEKTDWAGYHGGVPMVEQGSSLKSSPTLPEKGWGEKACLYHMSCLPKPCHHGGGEKQGREEKKAFKCLLSPLLLMSCPVSVGQVGNRRHGEKTFLKALSSLLQSSPHQGGVLQEGKTCNYAFSPHIPSLSHLVTVGQLGREDREKRLVWMTSLLPLLSAAVGWENI